MAGKETEHKNMHKEQPIKAGLSESTNDQQYSRLFKHFRQLETGGDKQTKQQSLQKCFKKRIDK